MRFMMIVKASQDSEAGKMPSMEMLQEMGKFNEEMVKAGVMLAGEGLMASSEGARIQFEPGKKPVAIDGPFAETKELIAGYWMIQVKSKEEAIAWAMKSPSPHPGESTHIEVRRVFESADFGPEVEAQEQELRDKIAKGTKS